MGRKPRKVASTADETPFGITPEPATAPQEDAFVRREVDEPPTRAERISLKLKDDGLIDWESHRGDTREKIIKAFANDAESLRMIGLSSPLLPDGQGITEENAKIALQMLATIDGAVVPFLIHLILKMKIDREVAAKAFAFNETQLKEMAPRAARVANKYSSAAMLKYQDEIALLGMFGVYLSQQIKEAVTMQLMVDLKKKAAAAAVQAPVENPMQPVNGGEMRE